VLARVFPRWSALAAAGLACGCSSASGPRTFTVSAEDREDLRESWRLYVDRDPAWPRAKHEWLARGDGACSLLVENLMAEIVRASDRNDPERTERAAKELGEIGVRALPHLAQAVRIGDDVVAKRFAAVVARIGPPAVPPLIDLLPREAARTRIRWIDVLGDIGDPRAAPALARECRSHEDWRVRASAAAALGRTGGSGALEALLGASRDSDPFVRARAAASLGKLGDARAVDALVDLLETSHASGDPAQSIVARESGAALRSLTGQHFRDDPRPWREWRARRFFENRR
jgi:hypothetical protein